MQVTEEEFRANMLKDRLVAVVETSMPELRTETMTVNMGPQHPSTHGVLRLVLELDGETVLSASPTIGYLHTGIEKTAEQKKWQQVIPLVERMDYLSAQSNSMAFCLSVERLLGIELPERVRNIRVLIAELQRINSHLVWLGTHGMEVGAVSVMLYCFRERELLLNLNEMLAGFRLFPELHARRRPARGSAARLPRGGARLPRSAFCRSSDEYEDLLTQNEIYRERTNGVGRISRGRCGCLRVWSGRSRAPPASTTTCARCSRISATRPTTSRCRPRTEGDVYSRYLVRVAEMRESVKLCRQALERIHADRARMRSPIRASRRRRRTASTPRWKR